MTTFDDRERAFENLFAHDQELAFRAQARRNREIGLWAAHQLGRSGDEAAAYANEILAVSIAKGGTEAVVEKLLADLRQHGLTVSDHQIRHRMEQLLAAAVERIRAE